MEVFTASYEHCSVSGDTTTFDVKRDVTERVTVDEGLEVT